MRMTEKAVNENDPSFVSPETVEPKEIKIYVYSIFICKNGELWNSKVPMLHSVNFVLYKHNKNRVFYTMSLMQVTEDGVILAPHTF